MKQTSESSPVFASHHFKTEKLCSLILQCICAVQLGPVYPGENRGLWGAGEFVLCLNCSTFPVALRTVPHVQHSSPKYDASLKTNHPCARHSLLSYDTPECLLSLLLLHYIKVSGYLSRDLDERIRRVPGVSFPSSGNRITNLRL